MKRVRLCLTILFMLGNAQASLMPVGSNYLDDEERDITWTANGNIILVMPGNSQASLIPVGSEYLYDEERDITWIANGNLANTLGQLPTGQTSWEGAVDWVSQLDYGNLDDWRLPTFHDSEEYCTRYLTTSRDACALSEMGYLYHNFLIPSFSNMGNTNEYWYGNTDANGEGGYTFQFWNGLQHQESTSVSNLKFMLIVRDGDIRKVPEPATGILLALGFLGIAVSRKRKLA